MNSYKEYIKIKKRTNIAVKICQLFIFIGFIFIWQFLSDKELINSFIFSSPKKIFTTLISLYKNNNLFKHIWITTYETILSFTVGTILGIFIASIMWLNKFLARVITPYLTILNSLPKVALGPIIIIWFGSGIKSIIIMALLISTIITIINIYNAFISIDETKIKLLKSMNASKSYIYFNLIIPGSISEIKNTIIINISMSLIGVIMGEFLVSKEGIGYLIIYGSQVFNLSLVLTGISLIACLSIILYYLANLINKKR